MTARTAITAAVLTAQSGNGEDDGHLPYEQFDEALTTPEFGRRPARTTIASIANANVSGMLRIARRGCCTGTIASPYSSAESVLNHTARGAGRTNPCIARGNAARRRRGRSRAGVL